jgi:hypothetical protein
MGERSNWWTEGLVLARVPPVGTLALSLERAGPSL